MRIKLPFFLLAVLSIAGCGRDKHTEPTDYAIKLYRPQPIGTEHRVLVTGSIEEVIEFCDDAKARDPKTDSYAYEIDTTVKVLANDPKAEGPVSQLTIAKAIKSKNGKTEEIFSAGTVVIEKRSADKTEFFVGDSAVNETAARILKTGGLSEGLDPSADDASFGTQERKCAGDSWPINAGAASAYFTRLKMACKPENIVGSTTLKEVLDVDGEKLLSIIKTFSLHSIAPEPPAGFTTRSCDGNMTSTNLIPVDAAKAATHGSFQMELNAIFDRDVAGEKITLKVSRKASHDLKVITK